MSAADTVKDVVRIATTAGLAKDVIDLLDKKAVLLAEQVATLEKDAAALTQENTALWRENRNLKMENENLQKQLQNARPKGNELAQKTQDILLHFFKQAREVSDREIAQRFQMELSVASYHTDILSTKKFISFGGIVAIGGFGDDYGDDSAKYEITAEGRKYIIENGLVK